MTISNDHRVRVARERRDRMRKRLLDAVMTSSARRQQDAVSVDDVITEAQVSRATFYKYFNSLDEAMAALGRELVDEMVLSLINLYGGRDDAFFKLTTGIQLFLLRSVIDPLWAAFVARTDQLAQDTEPLMGMTRHLETAREQKLVSFLETEAAASLTVGAMMGTIRYMVRSGHRSQAYVEDLTAMILRGLGVEMDAARDIVRQHTIFIREVAPERLTWWRDPWD